MYRGGKRFALLICAVLVLGTPAAAPADPGSPDLDSASAAVYPRSSGLGSLVLGAEGPGRGSEPRIASGIPAEGGDDSGLPFTGLSAVLVLGGAVILLGGGGLVRLLARRPGDGSPS